MSSSPAQYTSSVGNCILFLYWSPQLSQENATNDTLTLKKWKEWLLLLHTEITNVTLLRGPGQAAAKGDLNTLDQLISLFASDTTTNIPLVRDSSPALSAVPVDSSPSIASNITAPLSSSAEAATTISATFNRSAVPTPVGIAASSSTDERSFTSSSPIDAAYCPSSTLGTTAGKLPTVDNDVRSSPIADSSAGLISHAAEMPVGSFLNPSATDPPASLPAFFSFPTPADPSLVTGGATQSSLPATVKNPTLVKRRSPLVDPYQISDKQARAFRDLVSDGTFPTFLFAMLTGDEKQMELFLEKAKERGKLKVSAGDGTGLQSGRAVKPTDAFKLVGKVGTVVAAYMRGRSDGSTTSSSSAAGSSSLSNSGAGNAAQATVVQTAPVQVNNHYSLVSWVNHSDHLALYNENEAAAKAEPKFRWPWC